MEGEEVEELWPDLPKLCGGDHLPRPPVSRDLPVTIVRRHPHLVQVQVQGLRCRCRNCGSGTGA